MEQFTLTPYQYRQKRNSELQEFIQAEQKKLPTGTAQKVQENVSFAARWGAAIAALVISFLVLNLLIQVVLKSTSGALTIIVGIICPFIIMFMTRSAVNKKRSAKTEDLHRRVNEAIAREREKADWDIADYQRRYDAWQQSVKAAEDARIAREMAEEAARKARETAQATQKSAMQMANDSSLDMLAGQLCLQFRDRIQNADYNQFLPQIVILLIMRFDLSSLTYCFWQTGTVKGDMETKTTVPYYQINAPDNMQDSIIRDSYAQTLASKIQFRMLQMYAGSTPPVTVELSQKVLDPSTIGYRVNFKMDNPQYSTTI